MSINYEYSNFSGTQGSKKSFQILIVCKNEKFPHCSFVIPFCYSKNLKRRKTVLKLLNCNDR